MSMRRNSGDSDKEKRIFRKETSPTAPMSTTHVAWPDRALFNNV
jgi:hypothetical protein